MKILKYILVIIVILLIAFLLMGFIKPELTYDCEIMVDKAVSESWAVAQDEAKMSDWMPGFQRIEHVSGTPGEVGAVSNVYFDDNGKEMVIKETITEIVPNESISMKFENDFMDMDYKMELTPMDGKTKILTSTTAKGNGIFSKSIMALMGSTLKGQEESNLGKLKKTIEENEKDYSPSEKVLMEE